MLLDIVLGKEDGRDVFRELRLMSDVPTIFLTGRGLETDRIAGLKMGADDYMVKPFSLAEVSARIESVLRRASGAAGQRDPDEPSMNFGPLQINELTHEVRLDGELVELTSKEFALLAFLAASPRRVYSREQLLENVWLSSPEWQGGATVTEHIRRLRSKIEVLDRTARDGSPRCEASATASSPRPQTSCPLSTTRTARRTADALCAARPPGSRERRPTSKRPPSFSGVHGARR